MQPRLAGQAEPDRPPVPLNLPLDHVLVETVDHRWQPAAVDHPRHPVARLAQRRLDRLGGRGDAALAVGERVDVLGGPVHHPVQDQRQAAAEGEAVPPGHHQGYPGDLGQQRIGTGHQAAAATGRSTGCRSSQARRTPRGR
ncbi:hypothetical protein GCM10027605_40170 [Micromonospora zhanjiangensis]